MNKREWERRFLKGLKPLAGKERNEALEYYREIYGDKIDAGFSEEEILREFGKPEDCARKILEENGISVDHNAKKAVRKPAKSLAQSGKIIYPNTKNRSSFRCSLSGLHCFFCVFRVLQT